LQVYEYLSQAKRLDSLIENKREEEKELWALATSITQSSDGMPHGSSDPDKMTGIIQKIITAQERTNAAIDRYVDAKQDIIKNIEMLPKKQYDVLYWLYIKKRENRQPGQMWYYTWAEVAENLGCTEQNISNVRKRAARNLQKILDLEEKAEKVD
jgi:DNA-directed RNA polymerase specialized sigma subunit